MEWIEVTARRLDEAVELALDRLGVIADELEYQVLDEPRTGLFGIGRTPARIRARVKPLSREKPVDKRRRRRGEHRGGSRSREATPAAAVTATREGTRRDSGRGGDGERTRNRASGRRRTRSRGSSADAGAADDRAGGRGPGREAEANDLDGASTLSVGEQARAATEFTDELVSAFGVDASVSAEVVEDVIELRIDGQHLGVLVGPKGATLQALEELVRAVVQHAAGGQSARLHLDVGGYRQRRREALAQFAQQVARDVAEQGTERALEPMNPPDRKVVHDTVAEIDGVVTTSVGEEPRRRVVIKPA
jgi:spoIIIJ-associated protein